MGETIIKVQEWVTLYGLKAIAGIIILVLGVIASKTVRSLIRRILQKSSLDNTLILFFSNICYVALLAFIITAALEQIGVKTTSFIAVIGAAGLAVGLALQGSLGNFASGVLMIMFKPFRVGDYVEAGGAEGVVEEIGIFTTELRSPDNKKIIITNGKITGDKIVNCSAHEARRINLTAGAANIGDMNKVKGMLREILDKEEGIMKSPAVVIGLQEFGDKSLKLVVEFWVKTSDCQEVLFDVFENIKKRFDAEGINITLTQKT